MRSRSRSSLQLADAVGLRERIDAMWRGEHINTTEDRAVLHVALRQPAGAGIGGAEIENARHGRARAHAGLRRGGARRPHPGQRRRAVPAGGQHRHRRLGPGSGDGGAGAARLQRRGARAASSSPTSTACTSRRCWSPPTRRRTLFIVSSKTFTTLETLTNARTARAWLAAAPRRAAVPQHFAAVSVNHQAMDEFGVHPEYRFQMWDWVGGRYSIWSSIGVSLAIAIGRGHFRDFLGGGHEMDEHFRSAPWAENLPVLMGLIGVWNINFMDLPTLAVLPYDDSLRRFPAYLQQLEMESNGKSVMLDGAAGGVRHRGGHLGRAGQQRPALLLPAAAPGQPRAALDFLLPARSSCGNQPQQDLAIASCSGAGARPSWTASPRRRCARSSSTRVCRRRSSRRSCPTRSHPGSRPSTIVLFPQLDPATLGAPHRALRAQRVHAERRLGHQRLRPVGRGARQEAHRAARAGGGGSGAAPTARRRRSLKLLAAVDDWRARRASEVVGEREHPA